MSSPNHTATVDRYLEAIYYIAGEGEAVRPSRLAYWLDVSPPTVSDALQRLQRDGWLTIGEDRSVTLTDEGERVATAIVRRHRVMERWLTDVLGFDWASADVEADRLSSAISETVIDRIDQSMGSPATCPHGNVIPGRVAPYGALVALADLQPGERATIRRVSEIAEHEARVLLTLLGEHGFAEGTEVHVNPAEVGPGEISVRVGGETLVLPLEAARLIWVEAAAVRPPA